MGFAKSDFSIFHNTPDHISRVFLFRRSQRVKEKSQLLFSGSSQKLGQWWPHPPWRLFQKMNKEAGNELLIKLSNSLLRSNFVLPEARIGRVSNKTFTNIYQSDPGLGTREHRIQMFCQNRTFYVLHQKKMFCFDGTF